MLAFLNSLSGGFVRTLLELHLVFRNLRHFHHLVHPSFEVVEFFDGEDVLIKVEASVDFKVKDNVDATQLLGTHVLAVF